MAEVFGRIAGERYKQKDAVAHYQQALDIHQTSGNLPGQLAILDYLLATFREEEAWYEVKAYTRQKRHIFAHQNNQEQQAQMWGDLAELASAEWQLEIAQDYYHEAVELYAESGRFYEQAAVLYEQGAVAWRQRNHEQVHSYWQRSVESYGQAYRLNPRIPSEQELDQRINMLRRFATMALWEDNVILAVSYYQDILQFYQYMGEPLKQAEILGRIPYLFRLFDSGFSSDSYFMFRPLGGHTLIETLPERVAVLDTQLTAAAVAAFDQSDYPASTGFCGLASL